MKVGKVAVEKRLGYTWGQLERLAQDRDAWRALNDGDDDDDDDDDAWRALSAASVPVEAKGNDDG